MLLKLNHWRNLRIYFVRLTVSLCEFIFRLLSNSDNSSALTKDRPSGRDLLIMAPSFMRSPSAPVCLTWHVFQQAYSDSIVLQMFCKIPTRYLHILKHPQTKYHKV